jgi:hypothetical protein
MTNGLSETAIQALIESGDLNASIESILRVPAEDRKGYTRFISSALKENHEKSYVLNLPEDMRIRLGKQRDVLHLMLFTCTSLSAVIKEGWWSMPQDDVAIKIIKIFKPDWINEWVEWLSDNISGRFLLIRKLMALEICVEPKSEGYIIGMIQDLGRHRYNITPLESLREGPELLENEVWRLFELEGEGQNSLAAHDKFSVGSRAWSYALIELSNSEEIPRQRLLDASLDALRRDFTQFRAGWFSRFHELLQPTIEERAARVELYLLLLGSQISPTVSFSLKSLTIVNNKATLPVKNFLIQVLPVLESRTKSIVVLALRILEKLAASSQKQNLRDQANSIAQTAASALVHDSVDVQKRVLNLIDKYGIEGDPDISALVTLNHDEIMPSLKPRVKGWISEITDPEEKFGLTIHGGQLERVSHSQALPTIESFDELLAKLSLVLENPENILDVEVVLDGLARLGTKLPANFDILVGPIAKQASSIFQRGSWGQPVSYYIAKLVMGFAAGENLFRDESFEDKKFKDIPPFEKVLYLHVRYIARILEEGQSISLISLPSHGRGFISPMALIDRHRELCQLGIEPPIFEQVLALLRLDVRHKTNEHGVAVTALQAIAKTEFGAAINYALGGNQPIGDTASIWIAAACTRSPGKNCPEIVERFGDLGPDAGQAVEYDFSIRATDNMGFSRLTLRVESGPLAPDKIPLSRLGCLFHLAQKWGYSGYGTFGYSAQIIRWCSTIWPANLEAYFANGIAALDIDWNEVNWPARTFFEPLLESDMPIGKMASLLIALGIGAAEPGERGLAKDALIVSIEEGRLEIATLAACMGKLLPTGFILVSRWTKTLAEVSRVSEKHRGAIHFLIQAMLTLDPEDSPKGISGLVELLYELQVASKEPFAHKAAIDFFQRNNKGGKFGQYSKKMLALRKK